MSQSVLVVHIKHQGLVRINPTEVSRGRPSTSSPQMEDCARSLCANARLVGTSKPIAFTLAFPCIKRSILRFGAIKHNEQAMCDGRDSRGDPSIDGRTGRAIVLPGWCTREAPDRRPGMSRMRLKTRRVICDPPEAKRQRPHRTVDDRCVASGCAAWSGARSCAARSATSRPRRPPGSSRPVASVPRAIHARPGRRRRRLRSRDGRAPAPRSRRPSCPRRRPSGSRSPAGLATGGCPRPAGSP